MTLPPPGNTAITGPSGGHQLEPNADGSLNVNGTFSPAANQRVNAQSGDFLAGSIVDLATLLALAGTSGDANTVASLMGRLTKIRDLLNSTLNVSVTNGNANGQATMVNSAPVVIASDQTGIGALTAPNINEAWIQNAIRNGKGYMSSYLPAGVAPVTATNGSLTVCALSLFNPSASGKTLVLYSLLIGSNEAKSLGGDILRFTTSDPGGTTGFTATVTPTNLKPGGAAAVASVCASATGIAASITATGTIQGLFAHTINTYTEILTNGAVIVLAPGEGIELTTFVTTAGDNYLAVAKHIEY